ncbi:MAG TPA: hypothetical protein VFU43_22455 [Streptosporangiaceae bacterium]|nr:hypothetical protein [Streptosporangiaceae bacterium]
MAKIYRQAEVVMVFRRLTSVDNFLALSSRYDGPDGEGLQFRSNRPYSHGAFNGYVAEYATAARVGRGPVRMPFCFVDIVRCHEWLVCSAARVRHPFRTQVRRRSTTGRRRVGEPVALAAATDRYVAGELWHTPSSTERRSTFGRKVESLMLAGLLPNGLAITKGDVTMQAPSSDIEARLSALEAYVDVPQGHTGMTVTARLDGQDRLLRALHANSTEFRAEFNDFRAETNQRLTGVETRLTGVKTRLTGVETRLTEVEDVLGKVLYGITEIKNLLKPRRR